ncbi:2-dehydro-3-deoxy-D-gluconate 5-dehydrogenase KduD [Limnochorda pilosa]|uniref:2-deoxy-D-gluconate 3-dehydrogenase n=1 Tax=Limnochorda pilosa TaxID=1555112 RepID=A0A0K2SNA2_LIMPI|nr:2-dehydro-3-deoxy-D-gluconate 5-dehydrogenase KduD [Limnochorda pilosa]BAS28299.1 2-deoxy-D-gluconate 3-dehydrogenase [Limnochorda pilosa]
MQTLFDLSGKVAIVTGASRGIGQALAVGLAEAGADIAGVSRGALRETEEQVTGRYGRCFEPVQVDLRHPDAAERIFAQTLERFTQVDILVNNAGIIRRNQAIDVTDDEWDEVMLVNLKQVFALSRQAGRYFRTRGRGKIINIASMLSFQGGILVPSYAASKSGVLGLTRALANEWAPLGINVNAIAPGYVETEATRPIREDPQRNASILERIPAGRWGRPEDLKGAAVFLASHASDYVHGAVIPVDGGWLAR